MSNNLTPEQKTKFIADNLKKPLALTGLMLSGKTTLGKMFAEAVWSDETVYVDSDDAIVSFKDMTIPNIFDKLGEPEFRDIERTVITGLMAEDTNRVIALGGGAFINDMTRALIKGQALSVYFEASLDTLQSRANQLSAEEKENRPLLSKLPELLPLRDSIYAEADITINIDGQSEQETLDCLIKEVYNHLRNEPK